jgi:eukaryotic-like serine/threonine-protein kinase
MRLIMAAMSATLLDAISVGRVIDGRFPLLQELGGTERTSAWLTELDDRRAQKAAIKLFPFESVDASTTLARWDLARTLSHPHLMPLFYAGRCDLDGEDLLYVVTEYADETLSQILPERPLSPEEVREMLLPVLSALAYLHKLSLTHGHLRPTNIMVIDDRLKLSPDFGWRPRRRSIYDPPEAGAGTLSSAADIWSLGILLVEALTQQPPLWDKRHGAEPEIPAAIPEPFFTICRECLRIDPERRSALAQIKAHLSPPPIAEPALQPADPDTGPIADLVLDRTTKPSYKFPAMILTGAVLFFLLMIAAFKCGWDLTPSSLAVLPQTPFPEPAPPALPTDVFAASTVAPAPQASAAESLQGAIVKGSVAHQVLPDIPEEILGAIQGHIGVTIRVEVDPKGNVYDAFIDSSGPSPYFANRALHAVQNWKFTPAKMNGRATASLWLLEFQFGQTQIAVTPSEESP